MKKILPVIIPTICMLVIMPFITNLQAFAATFVTNLTLASMNCSGDSLIVRWTIPQGGNTALTVQGNIDDTSSLSVDSFSTNLSNYSYTWTHPNPTETYYAKIWIRRHSVSDETILQTTTVSMAACTMSQSQIPTVSASQYVTADGKNLALDGKIWKFTGYNDYMLTSDNQNPCGSIM